MELAVGLIGGDSRNRQARGGGGRDRVLNSARSLLMDANRCLWLRVDDNVAADDGGYCISLPIDADMGAHSSGGGMLMPRCEYKEHVSRVTRLHAFMLLELPLVMAVDDRVARSLSLGQLAVAGRAHLPSGTDVATKGRGAGAQPREAHARTPQRTLHGVRRSMFETMPLWPAALLPPLGADLQDREQSSSSAPLVC